ncbi:MAG: FAD-binding protein [Dermatophilaceae bacterium]|nr:FAD-binding protein [Dermatophilaceae bacterium]
MTENPTTTTPTPEDRLVTALRSRVRGEVRADLGSRGAYAVDSSNYRYVPTVVVNPLDPEDAVAAVAVCREHDASLVSRGGGTSLAGQTTGPGVVIDWSRHCTRVESVDVERRRCVVEPGIALDDLNRALGPHGLMYGPKPSTHRTCTIGGMIGNNSCGSTAQAYGKTVDNVHRLEVLTYDGTRMWVGPTSEEEFVAAVDGGGRRAEIHQALRGLRDENLQLLRTRYPKIPRRVSGYNLDSLLPENHFDLARALVGSEGTLVTVLRAELELVEVPKATAMVVLGFPDIADAGDAVPQVVSHDPWLLEGLDDVLIDLERELALAGDAVEDLPKGRGWLVVQFSADTQEEADGRAKALLRDVEGNEHPPTTRFYDDSSHIEELVRVREAGLGATAHPSARHDTWPGWEDSAVPPERLGEYLRELRTLFDEYGYREDETSIYGHFGQGCVHCSIPFELRTADGIANYHEFTTRAAHLVVQYGGSLSGEHGDGQARGDLLRVMFGDDVVALFEQVKDLFDPHDRMNPGKVVRPNPRDTHLRLGTDYAHPEPRTEFGFPHDDGRFSRAVLRCAGIGNCRTSSSESQVMCPSYMVTRDEVHSTRGRSRLLFEMMRGDAITDGWRSTEVRDALDLCLACKGCKSDCPVGVDMATYKVEFLSHHYRHRVRPAAHYSMGWLPLTARVAARTPRAVNRLTQSRLTAPLLKRLGGIAPERSLPAFAEEPFTASGRGRRLTQRSSRAIGAEADRSDPDQPGDRGRVILWPDTFSNYFHPSVLASAVDVLEAAGFTVEVPHEPVCCGLTWISTGQLRTAKRVLRHTVSVLRDDLRAGTPVVGLEPSCTAVFRSDGPELLPGDEDVRRLAHQTMTLAELLRGRAPDWRPPHVDVDAIVQTHCHQHAVMGTKPDDELLEAAGVDADRLGSGCCGLAGNFGFERGHYDVSVGAAERVLLPRVRDAEASTVVLADGFSCRTQVEQETGRHAVHLAELLARGLRENPRPGGAHTDQHDHPRSEEK